MQLPHCPKCHSEYTYQDNDMYICPECAYEWNVLAPLSPDRDCILS